jgi:hypothetical protein
VISDLLPIDLPSSPAVANTVVMRITGFDFVQPKNSLSQCSKAD